MSANRALEEDEETSLTGNHKQKATGTIKQNKGSNVGSTSERETFLHWPTMDQHAKRVIQSPDARAYIFAVQAPPSASSSTSWQYKSNNQQTGIIECIKTRRTLLVVAATVLVFLVGATATLSQPPSRPIIVSQESNNATHLDQGQVDPPQGVDDSLVLSVVGKEEEVERTAVFGPTSSEEGHPTSTTEVSVTSVNASISRSKLWDINLSEHMTLPATLHAHPQLVFIKGVKVGGASVAVALNHATVRYNIKLALVPHTAQLFPNFNGHCEQGAMYFHHAWKAPWMEKCISSPRYVTVFREPISQELSFLSSDFNLEYFRHYPTKQCQHRRTIPIGDINNPNLGNLLKSVQNCVDTEFRKNITYNMVAQRIATLSESDLRQKSGVWSTLRWVSGLETISSAEDMLSILDREYFVVGVTERLNELLVLLATVNGWDPAALYYRNCKPNNVELDVAEFETHFPRLMAKLRRSMEIPDAVYNSAKTKFEKHLQGLGPWFSTKVKAFEAGLREFQRKQRHVGSYEWKMLTYVDGQTELC